MSNNRATDSNNDTFLLNSQIARVVDGAQVVQRVRSRVLFYEGEGIFDTTEGTPWFQSILGKPFSLPLTESLVKGRILGTPNLQSILTFELVFDRVTRGVTITFSALTTYGEIVSDELYINI